MFGSYVRFKCNYAALRKFSDNQQQHLLLGQRWIIGNTMWIWKSTSSHRYWFIRSLESLTDLLTIGQIWVFLRAFFLRWWATLRHVHIQGRNTTQVTMTCNFWYRHSQPLGRSQVYPELSSHVSVTYIVRVTFYFYTIII